MQSVRARIKPLEFSAFFPSAQLVVARKNTGSRLHVGRRFLPSFPDFKLRAPRVRAQFGYTPRAMNTPISALLERKGSTVFSIAPNLTIADAVAEMNRHRIGSIVIIENNRLAGIFTERDVLRRVVGDGVDPKAKRVRDVMTTDLITVTPETTVEETMVIFTDKRCRHLPVLADDRLVGLISIGDISRWVAETHQAEAEHLKNYIAGGFSA